MTSSWRECQSVCHESISIQAAWLGRIRIGAENDKHDVTVWGRLPPGRSALVPFSFISRRSVHFSCQGHLFFNKVADFWSCSSFSNYIKQAIRKKWQTTVRTYFSQISTTVWHIKCHKVLLVHMKTQFRLACIASELTRFAYPVGHFQVSGSPELRTWLIISRRASVWGHPWSTRDFNRKLINEVAFRN